ncbi:MAG: tetratricopeptide repeat protein [Halobacteriota archaeon]
MTGTKFCKSCGTTGSPSASFCRECGAALTEEPSVDQSASNAKEQVNGGIVLYQQGDYPGALSKFEKAIEADPTLAAAWSDKGCALGRLGKRDAALEAFNKALEIDRDNREAREGKDLCLRMVNSSQEAS